MGILLCNRRLSMVPKLTEIAGNGKTLQMVGKFWIMPQEADHQTVANLSCKTPCNPDAATRAVLDCDLPGLSNFVKPGKSTIEWWPVLRLQLQGVLQEPVEHTTVNKRGYFSRVNVLWRKVTSGYLSLISSYRIKPFLRFFPWLWKDVRNDSRQSHFSIINSLENTIVGDVHKYICHSLRSCFEMNAFILYASFLCFCTFNSVTYQPVCSLISSTKSSKNLL